MSDLKFFVLIILILQFTSRLNLSFPISSNKYKSKSQYSNFVIKSIFSVWIFKSENILLFLFDNKFFIKLLNLLK